MTNDSFDQLSKESKRLLASVDLPDVDHQALTTLLQKLEKKAQYADSLAEQLERGKDGLAAQRIASQYTDGAIRALKLTGQIAPHIDMKEIVAHLRKLDARELFVANPTVKPLSPPNDDRATRFSQSTVAVANYDRAMTHLKNSGASKCALITAWLGFWRDDMPAEAVEQLQDHLGDEPNVSESAPPAPDRG